MKKLPNKKQYFKTLEELYNQRFNVFLQTAHKYIFNPDYAIDAVHDAFLKAQEYVNKQPGRNVREQLVNVHVIRACIKMNKRFGREIPSGTMENFDA